MTKVDRDRSWWLSRVQEWERSGESAGEFGRRWGVDGRALGAWRRRLRDESGLALQSSSGMDSSDSSPRFVELFSNGSGARSSATAEWVTPKGWTLRLCSGCDPETVSRVLKALSGVAW